MRLKMVVFDIIRWHYYERQRGQYSADPGLVGMDYDLLSKLEKCVGSEMAEILQEQGLYWANYELEKPYDENTGGKVEWEEAEQEYYINPDKFQPQKTPEVSKC